MPVAHKSIIVTGAGSGIGEGTARHLAAQGALVTVNDINAEAGEAFAKECGERAMFIRHDVASEADWAAAIAAVQQRFGALDILVNNAGILIQGSIATATLAQFRQLMQVNADSCFIGCQQGIAAMKERGGSIVNMASVSSWLPIEGYAGYSATKAAVASLTRSSALYCRNNGLPVRVNSIHPDGIYTPMMQASAPGVPAKHLLFDPKTNPKGRATMPGNIAKVILFLASDDSKAISGAEMRADSAILGTGL